MLVWGGLFGVICLLQMPWAQYPWSLFCTLGGLWKYEQTIDFRSDLHSTDEDEEA